MIMCMRKGLAAASAQRKSKRGFTLTEIAIVLGIVGLILGAIWVAAAAVYTNLRVSKATTELLTIAQNVRAMYATNSLVDTTSGMKVNGVQTGAALTYIEAGVFPSDMVVGGTATQDPWGGGVAIVPTQTSATGTAGDSFAVEFDQVPQSACISMLTSNTGNGRDSGLWEAIGGAGGTLILAANATLVQSTFPLTATLVTGTYCAATAATGNNVAFAFHLKG